MRKTYSPGPKKFALLGDKIHRVEMVSKNDG
jgi:hypothetical protein